MKCVIGIDLGGTNTEIGLVDENGKIINNTTIPTNSNQDFNKFISQLSEEINKLLKNCTNEIIAIGVGAPNANYYNGTIENAPNLSWKGVLPFSDMLKLATGLNVVLTNDANAAAIGEGVYGGAKLMKHYAVITLGTGVGSGIVCDGKLLYGNDGFAGEFGHVIVNAKSRRLCGCGRYGCLETYASATGIVKTMNNLLVKYNQICMLRNIPNDKITSLDIFHAAQKGDELALKAFEITADVLALSLANFTAVFSPEAIFLSGGLAKAENILFDPLQKYYDNYVLPLFKGKTKILLSQLPTGKTGLIGAAALAFNEYEKG